jgi:MFS family permease
VVSKIIQKFHQHLRSFFIFLDILGIIATIIEIITPNIINLIIGRLILGFVAGNNSASISIYVREFSPKKDAAITGSISPLLLNFSIVVVYFLGFMLPSSSEFEDNNFEY